MSKTVQNETEIQRQEAGVSVKNPALLQRDTLLAHFKALRNMLIISALAIGIAFLAVFLAFSQQLMDFLSAPLVERNIQVIYTALAESLTVQMKAALIVGIIIASPVVIWQVWKFIKPALYPKEGKAFVLLFLVAVFLFLLGTVFAYVVVFNMAVSFFLISGEGIATPMISIDKYVSFLFGFVLPFGLTFELPIAMVILTRLGILQITAFTKVRKYVIFSIFVLAAILTPPDVISQVCLGVPLCFLYEVGIIASRIAKKKSDNPTENPA